MDLLKRNKISNFLNAKLLLYISIVATINIICISVSNSFVILYIIKKYNKSKKPSEDSIITELK